MSHIPLIQKVAEKCQEFHQRDFNPEVLNQLVNLVHRLKSQDLNFNLRQYSLEGRTNSNVFVIPVYYDQYCTIVIYALKSNCTIPIHDHPGMYSILKALEGKLQIVGYAAIDGIKAEGFINVKQTVSRVIGPTENAQLTTPQENFHSLTAFGGSAGYIDILCPPYDGSLRQRSEYELSTVGETFNPSNMIHLRKTAPKVIPFEEAPYTGPKVEIAESTDIRSGANIAGRVSRAEPAAIATSTAKLNYSNGLIVTCPKCESEFKLHY